jgi:hypothetical protein
MFRTVTLGALVLVLSACGGGNPAGPGSGSGSGSGSGGSGRGTVTATIDGVAYTGAVNSASLNSNNGIINVSSNSADLTRAIAFAVTGVVGTYPVGTSAVSLTVQTTNGASVTGAWTASGIFGSGTLTITSLTSTRVTGTFSFTGVIGPGSPGTGTKSVTNGAFTANF